MNRYYVITVKRKGSFTRQSLLVLEFLESDFDPDGLADEYLQELRETACESGIKGVFGVEEITEKAADLIDDDCVKNLDTYPEYAELIGRFLNTIDDLEDEEWTPECN